MLPNLKTVANSVQELAALLQCLGPERNPAGRAALPLACDTLLDQVAWEKLFRNEMARRGECPEWRCVRWLEGLFYIVDLPLSITHDSIASSVAKSFSNVLFSGLNELGRLGSDFVDIFDTPVTSKSTLTGGDITRFPTCGWVPRNRERVSGLLRPTAILEVGVTGSSEWMLENARSWLADYDYISMVISIYVNATSVQKLKQAKANGADATAGPRKPIPAKMAIIVRTDGENEGGCLWERGWFDMNSATSLRELEQQGLALSALYMESSQSRIEADKLVSLRVGVVKHAIDEHYGVAAKLPVAQAQTVTPNAGVAGIGGNATARPKAGKPPEEQDLDDNELALQMLTDMKGLSSDSLGIEAAPPTDSMFNEVGPLNPLQTDLPALDLKNDDSSNDSDWDERMLAQQVAEIERATALAERQNPRESNDDQYLELLAASAGVNGINDLRLLLEQYTIEYRAKQLPELPKELETQLTETEWHNTLTGGDGMNWRQQGNINNRQAGCIRWDQGKMWLVELDCSIAASSASSAITKQIVPLGFTNNWLDTGVTFIDENLGVPVRRYPAASYAPDPDNEPDMRSFILEIGVFRSRDALLEDARYWLETYETAQTVMVIHLDEAHFDWRQLPMAYSIVQRGNAAAGEGLVQTPWVEFGFDSGASNECTRPGLVIADIPFLQIYPPGSVPPHLEESALSIDMFRVQQTVYAEMIEKGRLVSRNPTTIQRSVEAEFIPLPERNGNKRNRPAVEHMDEDFIGELQEDAARPNVTKTVKSFEGELPAQAAAAAVHEYVTQLVTQSLANNPALTEALSKMMAQGQLAKGQIPADLAALGSLVPTLGALAGIPAAPAIPAPGGFPSMEGGFPPVPPAGFPAFRPPGVPPVLSPNGLPWFINLPQNQGNVGAQNTGGDESSAPVAPEENPNGPGAV